MTPKEKAKELVKEYSWNADKSDAKQCALICIDEILKAMYVENRGNPYWEQIKQEVKKL